MSCKHKYIVSKWSAINGVNHAIGFTCQYCLSSPGDSDEVDKKPNQGRSSSGVRDKGNPRSSGKAQKTSG